MEILIQKTRISDPASPHHQQVKDVLIKDGKVAEIGDGLLPSSNEAKTIFHENSHLSPGFFDLRVNFCDPGYEQKEDFDSGSKAAEWGGVTGVGLMPHTIPPLTTKAQLSYLRSRATGQSIDAYPLAGITKSLSGNEITEMIDLVNNGAIAFTDGDKSLDANILKRAMLYAKACNGLLILHPEEHFLAEEGEINESPVNLKLGLKGKPAIAEHIAIARDLELCQYTNGRVHFSKITTARSVELIRKAKKEGLNVSTDVQIYHLLYSQEDLASFSTQLKFNPPLRTKEDREALRKGVLDGTIDVVTSDHQPVEEEHKKCEFQLAETGAIGVQTLFPLLLKACGKDALDQGLPSITNNPRSLFKLSAPSINTGQPANFTLFDPDARWTFNAATNASKSKNSPVFETELSGRALGLVNKGQYIDCTKTR